MRDVKEYSSLPIVVVASTAILITAAAGWFVTGRDSTLPFTRVSETSEVPIARASAAATAGIPLADAGDALVMPPPAFPAAAPPVETPTVDIDSELRKARLAAAAEMLVSPPGQNALHYYSRIVAAVPDHSEAVAEFDAVLARIAFTVSDHLASGELSEAYRLAALVAASRADHALVEMTRQAIDNRAARLIDLASRHARAGDDEASAIALAEAAALPGIDSAYVAANQDAIAELQRSRLEAEAEQLEQQQLAAEEATVEWTGKVRGAIKSGRLVSPSGDSARDFLAERDAPKETVEQLTDELLAALMTESQLRIDAGEVAEAETYIAAASELRADAEGLIEMRDRLERRIIQAEEAKVLGLNDFVRLNTTPARYPRLANQLNITGWVDVMFTVTRSGSTADISVAAAEPEEIFDESAIRAVEQWTFQPRVYRGQVLNQRATARLAFRLE